MSSTVKLFTDGACRGNPGPGGWGVLMQAEIDDRLYEKRLFGGEPMTTNNRMELMAVIKGLESLKKPCRVEVVTDSRYVRDGYTRWLAKWRRSGWRRSSGGAVKNKDLWQALERAVRQHSVQWSWVRGHSGHKENEVADSLANAGVDSVAGSH